MKKILALFTTALLAFNSFSQNGIIAKPNSSLFFIDTINSKYLNEQRAICVYLPPKYSNKKTYPVIYATDGQSITTGYIKSLDSLIDKKIIGDIILIGIFSNEKESPESKYFTYRNYEYVKKNSDGSKDSILKPLFNNHMQFFLKEVIPYAQSKYSASSKPKSRLFYGTSNGAGFGVTLAKQYPNTIHSYILLSPLGDDFADVKWNVKSHPTIFLSYGNKENGLMVEKYNLIDEQLKNAKIKHFANSYNGGHNSASWQAEFILKLIDIEKNESSTNSHL